MSIGPHGELVIETLGDLADNGMGLKHYCDDCPRELSLTLDEAIHRWGRDQVYVRWRPPIKCSVCGSRNISGRVQANTEPVSYTSLVLRARGQNL